jgi:hypothetical protein
MAVLFAGCGNTVNTNSNNNNGVNDDPNDPNYNPSGLDFDNHSPYSVIVDNNTSHRLVAFRGEISQASLISGVPASQKGWGLAKTSQFSETSDFTLIFVTEEAYLANKDNLKAIEDEPFCTVYAFYNALGDNNDHYQVSSKLGGTASLRLNNNTNYKFEIRMDSPTGEILGYVGENRTNQMLYVEPGDYNLYPILKIWSKRDNEIYSSQPTYTSGNLIGRPYMRPFALEGGKPQQWNLETAVSEGNIDLSTGVVFITVNNQSNVAVRVLAGATPLVTTTGMASISPNSANIYQFQATQMADKTYPEEWNVNSLQIGTDQLYESVEPGRLKVNYNYTIEVTGADPSNLKISEISEGVPMNLEAIYSGS